MSLFSILDISSSAISAQSKRINVTASNLANADSVAGPDGQAYRAKQVHFEAVLRGEHQVGGVRVKEIVEDNAPMRREYSPGHPAADAEGYVEKPNVDPVAEMVNMIAASRSYEANVEVMRTGKELMMSALKIGEG